MTEERKPLAVVGFVDDPAALLVAAGQVRATGYSKWDCHTPYPVHGLDRAMGLSNSPIPAICLGCGFLGVVVALGMQGWMSAIDYPVQVGGKPLFSWPAFIPITFELFVLFAALAITGALIHFGRLGRWHHALHVGDCMAGVTAGRFAILLDAGDKDFTREGAEELLRRVGCLGVRTIYAEKEED